MKRIQTLMQTYWPFLCIVGLWFLFSSPYFVKGLVPYPSTYQVNHFHPWRIDERNWGPVKNGAMPDIITQIYPWKHFSIEQLKKGQVPLWNPNSFAGNPHVGNYQSGAFTPFNILFFILPFIDAWSLLVLLQPLLGGLFTYLFMRQLRVSKLGSTLSSTTFMFCGFLVVWMAYGTLSMAMVFLPLLLYSIEKSFHKPTKISYALISIALAISFFSGHFQTSLYVAGFSFIYYLYKVFTTKDKKVSLLPLLFFMIGIGISLIQILPSIKLYQYAVRSDILLFGGGIPFYYLVTSFAPDFFGNPVTRNDWFGSYAELASFIGIIPLVLAGFALRNKKNTHTLFFFLAGVVALLLAINSPLRDIIVRMNIPVISTSTPSRIIYLFSFSFAVLAGFGIDALTEMITKKERRMTLLILGGYSMLVLSVWVIVLFGGYLHDQPYVIAKKNLLLPSGLFGLVCILTVVNLFKRQKLILQVSLYVVLLLSMFDSYRFASKWMPFDARGLVFTDMPVIKAMQEQIGYGRIYGNLGAHLDTYYNIPSVEGYDPLYIQRYGEFIRSSVDGKFTSAERSVVTLPRTGQYVDRALDVLGVTLIYHPIVDTNQGWAYPVWKDITKYNLVYKDDRFQLFRNKTALPRASLFYTYEVITDDRKLIKRFYAEEFDFRNVLLLEEKPTVQSENIKANSIGSAKITKYEANTVEIEVETEKPGLLFIADNHYPGWKVTVNGKEQKIYRANYTFRGVVVPEGKSRVKFTYSEF